MSLKQLRIISVGKIRLPFWREAYGYYLEKLSHWRKITDTVIKDAPAELPPEKRALDESLRLAGAADEADYIICLDEKGSMMDSRAFSSFLADISASAGVRPCFVVGGPYGIRDAILGRAKRTIAFGRHTLPHEMARVLLLEQLYRAECILHSIPYHHD